MRTLGLVLSAAAIAVGAAYWAGYAPERRARLAAEAENGTLQVQLTTAESRIRLGELLGRALTLKDVALRQNYGQALELSTPFFDAVRAETASVADAGLRDGLNQVLAMRDAVTAALARADPTVVETLYGIELQLRRALGFTLPPEPPAVAQGRP